MACPASTPWHGFRSASTNHRQPHYTTTANAYISVNCTCSNKAGLFICCQPQGIKRGRARNGPGPRPLKTVLIRQLPGGKPDITGPGVPDGGYTLMLARTLQPGGSAASSEGYFKRRLLIDVSLSEKVMLDWTWRQDMNNDHTNKTSDTQWLLYDCCHFISVLSLPVPVSSRAVIVCNEIKHCRYSYSTCTSIICTFPLPSFLPPVVC